MAKFNYTDAEISSLIEDIYSGAKSELDLPEDFYLTLAKYLTKGVEQGIGGAIDSVKWGEADAELAAALQDNIYLFSAARTFQQTLEMSEALTDEEGKLISFKDFQQAATEIYAKYNGGSFMDVDGEERTLNGWLKTEYNTAIQQASNAKQWNKIEKQKETLPYLRFVAVGDELECEICGELDGTCLPVDDDFWDANSPEAHYNCRCVLEQLDKEEGEDNESTQEEADAADDAASVPENFRYNPGKQQEVFSTEGESKHPYFSVPKEYSKFARDNFGLPLDDE
jgi:SPP1 gp7 family putative phage head morphogenesis protein